MPTTKDMSRRVPRSPPAPPQWHPSKTAQRLRSRMRLFSPSTPASLACLPGPARARQLLHPTRVAARPQSTRPSDARPALATPCLHTSPAHMNSLRPPTLQALSQATHARASPTRAYPMQTLNAALIAPRIACCNLLPSRLRDDLILEMNGSSNYDLRKALAGIPR